MNGWSAAETKAAEKEIMALAQSGLKWQTLLSATKRYAEHVERTGEDPMPPSIWLRDGHWKKWLPN